MHHVCAHQESFEYITKSEEWMLLLPWESSKLHRCLNEWKIPEAYRKVVYRSTTVLLCNDIYTHKYTNTSLLGETLACAWPHTHSKKQMRNCSNWIFLLNIPNTPPVSQSPLIQIESWGQVSHMHPARWEEIIPMCSLRPSARTQWLEPSSMAYLVAQPEDLAGDSAALC